MGVNKNVSSFVIPVGATINMDGTAIMQGMATVFIAQMSGIDLNIISIHTSCYTCSSNFHWYRSSSFGWNDNSVIILQQFGLPLEAIGIILAVDRILDMLRTSVNVTGDAAVACIVADSENLIDKNLFNK